MGRRALKRWWVRVGEGRRRRAWMARHRGRPVDVVVSHVEVNDRHGTGVLTRRLFGGAEDLVSVRSRDNYDARQDFGVWSARIAHPTPVRAAVVRRVRAVFRDTPVRRAVVIPYYPDDVWNALALKDLGAGPLCTYVMDDRNVEAADLPDPLLAELLSRSALRLGVSEEICEAYERKFGLSFAFAPPVVDSSLIPRSQVMGPAEALQRRRGVMIGNVWGQGWLARLCEVVQGTGVEIDWYTHTGLTWHVLDEADLTRAGIRLHLGLPERELIEALRRAAFCLLPSGTLDGADDNRAIAKLSLPSKLLYTIAVAHLPALVLGHPETAAAHFVVRQGVGLTAPYQREAVAAAVAQLVEPGLQSSMRSRAAALAPALSDDGAAEWIWRSLAAGRPADERYERLRTR